MYNDFLGEAIAEETRTGMRRKPNFKNPITIGRKKLAKTIDFQAKELGRDKGDVALEYVEQKLPDIQRYVVSKGEQPLANPVELSMQAFMLRKRDINRIKETLGGTDDEAEIYLDEAESKAAELNSSEADNFLGGVFAAIGGVVEKAASKQVEKRKEQGKKPGFWGFLAGNTNAAVNTIQPNQTDSSGLKIFANDVLDAIKKQEKQKEIKKMLPIIIVALVVIILITILITRNASKN